MELGPWQVWAGPCLLHALCSRHPQLVWTADRQNCFWGRPQAPVEETPPALGGDVSRKVTSQMPVQQILQRWFGPSLHRATGLEPGGPALSPSPAGGPPADESGACHISEGQQSESPRRANAGKVLRSAPGTK